MSANGTATKTEVKAAIKITLPDVWELRHWDAYLDGQQPYREAREKDGKNANAILSLRFFGAMALYDEGFIQIEAPDQVMAILKAANRNRLPLAVANEIGRTVGGAIEAAVIGPLPDYSNGSSATMPTANGILSHAD